jgi:ABC-type Zn uptake system ZnuABC Zn-binding protein ZnuA
MGRRPILLAALLAATTTLVGGCKGVSEPAGSRLRVVATTTQIGDFARRVGGDQVAVTQLLSPNTDPHEFEPSPKDVQAVAEASVVLEHGLGLDDWLDKVVANAGGSATRVVTTTDVSRRPGGDPHVWLDPDNAKAMVSTIEQALSAADPSEAAGYRDRAVAVRAEITALDVELAAKLRPIPPDRRKIVTDHDAFGYFAAHYEITVVGTTIPSLSTAAAPSAKQLTELSATIRRENVRVVYAEASIDPRVERALADEAGVRLGPPLYGDALGPADGPAGTYAGMMRTNMDAIVAGIGTP